MVRTGSVVTVSYTLEVDGTIIDRSQEGNPFVFEVGSRQVIPGFEEGILGMNIGEKKSFSVSPEKGYGFEDPGSIITVSRDQLPADLVPEVGMVLQAQAPDGRTIMMRVTDVQNESIVVNLNHPLAGKTLNFAVEIIQIQ